MARSTKVKRPTIKPVKPSRMRPDRKPAPQKPIEPEIPDTREDLLAKIGAVLDKVDEKMAGKRDFNVAFGSWNNLLRDEVEEMGRLTDRLNKLINPDNRSDGPWSPDLIRETFGAVPGEIPTWSRPGTFLLWIDYVPVRCVWGGFADPLTQIVAADPNIRWPAPAGAMNAPKVASGTHKTPADLFRDVLQRSTLAVSHTVKSRKGGREPVPAFNLHVLSDLGKEATQKVLAESPWLVAALKRGPVDPIPLPPHLQAVQMTMFG